MTAQTAWQANAWDMVARTGTIEGSVTHRHVAYLSSPTATTRDVSDALHALCAVHGVHPGLAASALGHCVQPDACDWLDRITEGFVGERAYIARLAAAAGPLPSTPGQAESEAALTICRHTLEMLGASERRGCATGAVAALVHDWIAIRRILDRAADRFGVEAPAAAFPSPSETAVAIGRLGATPATDRAIGFGAQQLLAQHRAIWDLLEARASAREG